MHHAVLDQWSRGNSALHRRDARAKLLALLIVLIAINTGSAQPVAFAGLLLLLVIGILAARLPLSALLWRACVVLPVCGVFAAVLWFSDDSVRAFGLVSRSYLSALAVLLVTGTTPLPMLLRAVEKFGLPGMLLQVIQFVYRYLFLLVDQAHRMKLAAQCRGGAVRGHERWAARAAAGAIAVLFGRSYSRAEAVHRAMLSRGFAGNMPSLVSSRFGLTDVAFVFAALAPALGLHLWLPD
ncbi:MAG: energy-coupling factor transporter transmembrane component T family protein [Bryobacteraceae bacterium]